MKCLNYKPLFGLGKIETIYILLYLHNAKEHLAKMSLLK